MHTRAKRKVWNGAGWLGILVFFLPFATVFTHSFPAPETLEACSIACAVLCIASGFANKKWFLVPGSIGAGTALIVFVGYTLPLMLQTYR